MTQDIEVWLGGGIYRLDATLEFTELDSGTNGRMVRWSASPGESAILLGSRRITGWEDFDLSRSILRAVVPKGRQTRNLYIDGKSAPRACRAIARPATKQFTAQGLPLTADLAFLSDLAPDQLAQVELRGLNDFTDRYNAVSKINSETNTLEMVQPAWENNLRGWDTLSAPFDDNGFFIENALSLLDRPGQWFLDSANGVIYVRPSEVGKDLSDVELPTLQVLLSISGTVSNPVRNLVFQGITFSGTTWLEPSTSGGYVDQQTGGFISVGNHYPADGYPTYESARPHWSQVPSAVQVSAAQDITFESCVFRNLGGGGLGLGNDDNAHHSDVGLAVSRVKVTSCNFTAIGANAITVGGLRQQAHHPCSGPDGKPKAGAASSQRMMQTVSHVVLSNNRISHCADTYTSCTGILMTYASESLVEHNTITDMPYGAINLGYGWGANDPGGSPEYLRRGLYGWQPIFETPTTSRNNLIKSNLVARFGLQHGDVGGIYILSASPGTVLTRNVIVNERHRGLYPDEGSRFLTFTENVLMHPNWFEPNYGANLTGDHLTSDLTGQDNWSTSGATERKPERRVLVEVKRFLEDQTLPREVAEIILQSGSFPKDSLDLDPSLHHLIWPDQIDSIHFEDEK